MIFVIRCFSSFMGFNSFLSLDKDFCFQFTNIKGDCSIAVKKYIKSLKILIHIL